MTLAGKRVQVISAPPTVINDISASDASRTTQDSVIHELFAQAQQMLQTEDYDFVLLRTGAQVWAAERTSQMNPGSERYTSFWGIMDAELGNILGTFDNNTAILVILADAACTSFILAAAYSSLHGEIQGAQSADLARTLAEMASSPIANDMPGKSLLADKSNNTLDEGGYTEEESEIIRERLTGLGYIG